jgi:hypothetical protein
VAGLHFTLISDGSSDRAFLPLLKWVLNRNGVRFHVTGDWVDWGRSRNPPRTLAKKVESAVLLYPCDLLFIHRDAEGAHPAQRRDEIRRALEGVNVRVPPSVCLVPVRMMEAWFLFSERAIREASGNPSGAGNLDIPRIRDLEALPDPKATLNQLLRDASGLSGRRLRGFRAAPAIHRMAEIIDDFSPLLALPAFRALDNEVQIMAQQQGMAT